jgi:hypothetical protein
MIDAGRQVLEVAANQIKLDLVECPRAGRSAKVDLTGRTASPACDSCGEIASRSGTAFDCAGTRSAIAERAATPVW